MHNRYLVGAAALVLMVSTGVAGADPAALPPSNSNVSAGTSTDQQTGTTDLTVNYAEGPLRAKSSAIFSVPTVSATAIVNGLGAVSASAFLEYSFEAAGADGALVNINIQGSGVANAILGNAYAQLYTNALPGVIGEACGGVGCGWWQSNTFATNSNLTIASNTQYLLELIVGVTANTNALPPPGGGDISSASIDPTITSLDPNFTILLSPGVPNGLAAAVPEPATWAMMLLGFAGVAGWQLRRKGTLRPAAGPRIMPAV